MDFGKAKSMNIQLDVSRNEKNRFRDQNKRFRSLREKKTFIRMKMGQTHPGRLDP